MPSLIELLQTRSLSFEWHMWLPSALEFQSVDRFDCHAMHRWVQGNGYLTPVAAITAYVLAIFVVLPLIRWRKKDQVPAYMRHLFAIWNLVLSLFSAYGVWICAPFVYRMISQRSLHYAICSDHMMLGGAAGDPHVACYGPVGYMMTLFMLSKFPELLDTLFLVVMHKDVMFLHWYHHVTVLMYSWFAYNSATPSAVVFGTMNYTVHSVMYFYFFASQYTKALAFLRKPITSLQLLQMALGVGITGVAYQYEQQGAAAVPTGAGEAGSASSNPPCSRTYTDSGFFVFCAVLYGSYLVLFAKLYYDSYIKRSRRSRPSRSVENKKEEADKKKQKHQ